VINKAWANPGTARSFVTVWRDFLLTFRTLLFRMNPTSGQTAYRLPWLREYGEFMRTLWRIIAGLFRWSWRVLNFIREFILNLFLIVLILAGVGIWLQ
jgi:hypothetical protein